MKKWLLLFFGLVATPALAQWQVPLNAVPVGRGPGVQGFNSVAPGTAGNYLRSNGTVWASSAGDIQVFNVTASPYNATGNCSTDDTTAIQAAITAAITAGGGVVYFPHATCYKTTSQLLIDLSGFATRYQNRIILRGDGPGPSSIRNLVSATPAIKLLGLQANIETYFSMEGMRLTGGGVASSVGLQFVNSAFSRLFNVAIEGFAIGLEGTDLEQIGIHDSNIRYNGIGVRANASAGATSANSWTFVNSAVSNNSVYGLQFTNPNAITYVGGSIQYNGTVGGGSGQFGFKAIDAGNSGGYGTILFSGMVFEGNGGDGDFISTQQAGAFKANVTFDTVSFLRTNLTTVGYGTNQIQVSGAGTNVSYKIINSNFWGAGAYAANAARPAIANTNANAKLEIDGLTTFWSATEAPTTADIFLGTAGGQTGRARFAGVTSGSTILQSAAAASGTLTLPAATDTLIGKATTDTLTNKTFDTAGTGNSLSINGVAATTNTGTGAVARAVSPAFTTPNIDVATGTSLTATGLIKSSSVTAGIGYATGAGCTVTQLASKGTDVTCQGASGNVITNNAALGASSSVSFAVTNATVAANDNVILSLAAGGSAVSYSVQTESVSAGSFRIHLRNVSAGSLSQVLTINFAIIKSVIN